MATTQKRSFDVGHALASLLQPIEELNFFQHYWEKQPLVIDRTDPNYFRDVMSFESINELLNSKSFGSGEIRMAQNEQMVPQENYINELQGYAQNHKVLDLFKSGATIILQSVHKYHAPVARICRNIEKSYNCLVRPNLYITPISSQGFNPHYDSHDVVVMQLHGSKTWRLYQSPIELPHDSQPFKKEQFPAGEVTREFELKAGDSLYLPRGVMHSARTTTDISAHITLAIKTFTWADVLHEAILKMIPENKSLREYIPVFDLARANGNQHQLVQEKIRQLSDDLAGMKDFGFLFDKFHHEVTNNGTGPLMEDFLSDIRSLKATDANTRFCKRQSLNYWVFEQDDQLVFKTDLKASMLTKNTGPMLEYMIREESFSAAELPGDVPVEESLNLLRSFVAEGMLQLKH